MCGAPRQMAHMQRGIGANHLDAAGRRLFGGL
nr:MAG TPA: hypothetical protein [Caudoviricetes sp.]